MGRVDRLIYGAIERDDLDELKLIMRKNDIGFGYEDEDKSDLLELAISSKAHDCIKYCAKHMDIEYYHLYNAFREGKKCLKIILESADLIQDKKVKLLRKALENNQTDLFIGIMEVISVDLSKNAFDLILTSFNCTNYIEALKVLFKYKSITAYDYVMAGILRYQKWLNAFDYLLKKGHKMNDAYSYIKNGKTVYTALASKGTKGIDSDNLTEIYFKLMEHGYDMLEKEKCEPYNPGYMTISIRCNKTLWDNIIEITGPQVLVRKFILANNSVKMSYLLQKGINKDFRVGNTSMWEFALRNNCFSSAVAIYKNNPSINKRYYYNDIPLLKKMKDEKADLALKFFFEHSLGFGEEDFNERNNFCLNYFTYAIEAKINFGFLLKQEETHLPTLILSIISCYYEEGHGTISLDVMRLIKEKAKNIDLRPVDNDFCLINILFETENKYLMTTEILSFLVENGAKISFNDVALLVSKPTTYIEILEFIVAQNISLKGADDDLKIIETALKTKKPPNYIELLLRIVPKYDGDLELISWITGDYDNKIIEELIDIIIKYKLDLSRYDKEQKYFHHLMTTAKESSLSIDLLEKLKKAGADPQNNPSISILFQNYEKLNQNAAAIKPILQFFVDNQVDISEDDKENCYLDSIFNQVDVRLRKLEVIKMLINIGAKANSSTKNSILMRLLKMNIFAPEYYAAMFEADCNVNSVNINGETFLTRIMKVMGKSKRRTELVKIFMKHGADPLIKDKSGKHALDLAYFAKDKSVIDLMKK